MTPGDLAPAYLPYKADYALDTRMAFYLLLTQWRQLPDGGRSAWLSPPTAPVGDDELVSLPASDPGRPIVGGGYALRGVVVADDLDSLRGPIQGRFRLPIHLEASARGVYDFGDESDRRLAYEIVLEEACSPQDLATWLEREALIAAWSALYLPRVVRDAWESRHPVLREGVSWPAPLQR